ncbi:hypothetical protein [Halocatena salina]|uniref:Uncharacterized protein n=1 Tax=Halocatena salina TaxID=2934340 RepID=A0A8U0A6Z7_9EURY|nr:hypothetical protein [Halocatena salina]UPM44882.1 hypothetical protein MW046_15995 [Halocatena salina]
MSWAVYPAFALLGGYLLGPDALLTILPMVGTILGGVVGTLLFISRSGSLRQLGRFDVAQYGMFIVCLPIDMLYDVIIHYSAIGTHNIVLSALWALLLIDVCYGGAYTLVYGGGYQRLVHWFKTGDLYS